jgi:hypothetical protein
MDTEFNTDGHEWTQIPNPVLFNRPSFPSHPWREIIRKIWSREEREGYEEGVGGVACGEYSLGIGRLAR